MAVFCIIFLILSAVALTAEIIMRSVLKTKNFGVEKRWLCFHGKTIPAEDFLPHDIFETLIFIFSFSLPGLILDIVSMPVIGTLFCSLCFGALVLFGRKHFVSNLIIALKGEKLPSDRPDVGDRGICRESIYGDNYGRITFEYKGREYSINALSANETDIEMNEEVIVVHKEEGVCWVERIDEELMEEDEDEVEIENENKDKE